MLYTKLFNPVDFVFQKHNHIYFIIFEYIIMSTYVTRWKSKHDVFTTFFSDEQSINMNKIRPLCRNSISQEEYNIYTLNFCGSEERRVSVENLSASTKLEYLRFVFHTIKINIPNKIFYRKTLFKMQSKVFCPMFVLL